MIPPSFGLVVPAGPKKGKIDEWVVNLDNVIPVLQPFIDSLWMTDHFFWEDNPTYEAWTVITYLAMRYADFKVGGVVLGQSYRNPALLAKMASTLQMLSHGRVILGVGAGWKEDEYYAYGYPFPRPKVRVEQLEDTLEIITRLWNESGQVSYSGKHYQIANAYCEPKPDPMIPIMVGGGGKKTMMLAARFADMWNIPDANLETYTERIGILKQHCESIGRDFSTINTGWFGRISVGESEEQALARSDAKWTSQRAIVGTVEQVIEQIQAFVDIGVQHFIVEILDIEDEWVQNTLCNEIFPRFIE